MRVRLIAALASAAVCMSGAGSAQTMTPAPAAAPTAAAVPIPLGSAAPVAPSTYAPVASPAPGAHPPATMPLPTGGPLALDARYLRGTKTETGYRLTGQALVKDPCNTARFTQVLGNIFPPQYNVVQYRSPAKMGVLCVQRVIWATIRPIDVTGGGSLRYVTVRTQKGFARVPILPGPVM